MEKVGRNSNLGLDNSLGSRPRILRRDQNASINNTTNLLDATRGDAVPSRDGTPVTVKSLLNISIGDSVIASPSPHESRRARQVGPANTSSTDMTHIREHYMECIKLSTENKINSKNAFLLKLNSLISTEALTTEGETDFKMAGMAVDASAKIYAGRVDSVHYDTFSVLGALGVRGSSKETEGEEEAEGREGESKKSHKSQKKKKLKSKLEKPENLNYKNLELEYYDDPILKKIAAASDENGIGGLLALQLPMEEKFFQLKLDMSEPFPLHYESVWGERDYVTGPAGVEELFRMFDSIEECPAPTCALVEGYLFDEEGNFVRRGNLLGAEAPTYETDLDTLERMPSQTNCSPNLQLDLASLEDSFHSPDNTSIEEECAPLAPMSPALSPMSSIARVLELIEPTEYAYLSADTLRELRKKEEKMAVSNKLGQQNKATKRGAREGKKPIKLIDFSSQLPASALQFPKSAASLRNTDASVETKAEQKNFFRSEDLSLPFDSKVLSTLFLLPSLAVREQKQLSETGGEGELSYYNYDAETDLSSYIPFIHPVEGGREGEEEMEGNPETSPARSNFSLIAAPPRPERILLSYDKRPRQVDMKGLKSKLWGLIDGSSGEERQEANSGCVQFSLLIEQLLPTPGDDTGEKEFTSKALLFSTLLHLANEHTLVLEQPDHSSDINIYQSTQISE